MLKFINYKRRNGGISGNKMDTISKTQNTNKPIKKISWEEFDRLIDKLEVKINKSGEKFDGIIGVPRGGLIVAVCLSHRLNLPLIAEGHLIDSMSILLVDDIVDSGKTLNNLLMDWKIVKNIIIATLHYRNGAVVTPIYVENAEDNWIQYPWEDK